MRLRQSLTPGRRGMLVRLTAEEGRRPALLDALHRYSDGLDEEPGTELFIVHVDPDDANIVWLYEIFHDDEAQEEHRESRERSPAVPGEATCGSVQQTHF